MFGLFEIMGNGCKTRVARETSYPTIQEAVQSFGDKVIDVDYEGDDFAIMFVGIGAAGMVYSVEEI